MSETVRKALFFHYLLAGLGLVLLAVVWALGWIFSPTGLYAGSEQGGEFLIITALTLASWNLLTCVGSAGFFHAASKLTAQTFSAYKAASLRMIFIGVLLVFPVPLMTSVLGSELYGRVLALFVIVISMGMIMFGRARINMIGERLGELEGVDKTPQLEPFETFAKPSEEL